MSVIILFRCNGCDAQAEGVRPLRRTFISFGGRGHRFGRYHEDAASTLAPEGWIAFDPYTSATYCPDCWAGIVTANLPDDQLAPAREGDVQAAAVEGKHGLDS